MTWHMLKGKFLGPPRVWKNDAFSSHIHGRPHHEFNKWTPPGTESGFIPGGAKA